jgi:hypothetical protein
MSALEKPENILSVGSDREQSIDSFFHRTPACPSSMPGELGRVDCRMVVV